MTFLLLAMCIMTAISGAASTPFVASPTIGGREPRFSFKKSSSARHSLFKRLDLVYGNQRMTPGLWSSLRH